LPFVSLGLVAAGVALARDRSRALVRASLGIIAGMVLLAAGLAGLVLLLSSRPTAWSVLWTALTSMFVLVVVELLSAPQMAPTEGATPPAPVP
jgi:sulfite exporter TauE/SafE